MYLVLSRPWYVFICCMILAGFQLSCKKTLQRAAVVHREAGQQVFIASFQHVRFRLSDTSWEEHPRFQFWSELDVPLDVRKRIWLAEVWRPSAENIENVVVLLAGQQGPRYGWASYANIMTGQPTKWRPKSHQKMADIALGKNSIAGEIYDDGMRREGEKYGFTPHNTLLILVGDAGFYYMLPSKKKKQLVGAFEKYLLHRISGTENQINTIYFGGTSRGGALAFRLTKRFLENEAFIATHFLLATLDAVANPHQRECSTYKEKSHNPLDAKLFAHKADLRQFFSSRLSQSLDVFQVVGGSSVIAENIDRLGVVRPFVDKSYISQQEHHKGLLQQPFTYTVRWVSEPHTIIGRSWSTEGSGAVLRWLQHIRNRDEASAQSAMPK